VDECIEGPFGVLIAGPTASGKSGVAMALAAALDGEVVNADSMLVYQDLHIVTARPSAENERVCPHHLYGHIRASEAFSTGRWLEGVVAVVAEIRSRGRVPIVVGGTGLYFRALTDGFVEVPAIPEGVRTRTRAEVEAVGPSQAHELLGAVDARWAAKVHENDPQRIARGLEVYRATGRALSDWHDTPAVPALSIPLLKIVMEPDRDWLYERIDRRFETMVEAGALAEVAGLLSLDLAPTLPAMKALGVPELSAHIRENLALEKAIELGKMRSRQYAKRQSTWIKQKMISWNHVFEQDLERKMDKIFSFIGDCGLTDRL